MKLLGPSLFTFLSNRFSIQIVAGKIQSERIDENKKFKQQTSENAHTQKWRQTLCIFDVETKQKITFLAISSTIKLILMLIKDI